LLTFLPYETYHQGINHTGAPMKSLPTLAAAAALFTGFTVFAGLSSPARAEESQEISVVEGWHIFKNKTWCSGGALFKNDTGMAVNIGVSGSATIVLSSDHWDIPEGKYPVVVAVDRMAPATFQAKGKGTLVTLQWSMDADEINVMSNGAVFRATVGREILEFSLAGSTAMLEAVGRCVGQLASANPFAGSPAASKTPPASTETPSNPFRRL
jgi:hypothetical protein